jgi:asparagine synthase (glutamine-hydrolysing)
VPKTIAENGYKVMLSGIGGDEIFWGYEWTRLAIQFEETTRFSAPEVIVNFLRHTPNLMKLIFNLSRSRKVPATLRPYFRLLYTWLVSTTPPDQAMFMGISGAPEFTSQLDVGVSYYPDFRKTKDIHCVYRHTKNINTNDAGDNLIIDLLSKLNRTWLISNCVQLADTVSMSNSIESRSPFLNANLIKTMLAYNTQNRSDRQGSKMVLRQIMENKLPKKIVNRPKSGFVTPVAKWVNLLEKKYENLLANGKLVELGLIRPNFFKIYDSRNVTLHTKYRLILLEIWYSNLLKKYIKT